MRRAVVFILQFCLCRRTATEESASAVQALSCAAPARRRSSAPPPCCRPVPYSPQIAFRRLRCQVPLFLGVVEDVPSVCRMWDSASKRTRSLMASLSASFVIRQGIHDALCSCLAGDGAGSRMGLTAIKGALGKGLRRPRTAQVKLLSRTEYGIQIHLPVA